MMAGTGIKHQYKKKEVYDQLMIFANMDGSLSQGCRFLKTNRNHNISLGIYKIPHPL